MLRAANLTGKPAVQTDLQPTKLAVTITWDLATSAPKKPKNRRSTKTAKPEPANRRQPATSSTSTVQQLPPARQPDQPIQPEQPLSQTTPPPTATLSLPPTATLIFSRPNKTATPAPQPTATVQLPEPKPAPAEKRPAPSPDADETRPTQQPRRVSPTVTAINDQPLVSTAATTNDEKYEPPSYDSFDTRPREVGKPYPLAKKYKFGKTFWIERPDDGEQIVIVQAYRKQRPDETLNVDLPAYFLRATNCAWTLFKGPTSKYHHEIWWNYLDSYSGTKPRPEDDRLFYISRVNAAAKEGRMDQAQPFYDE